MISVKLEKKKIKKIDILRQVLSHKYVYLPWKSFICPDPEKKSGGKKLVPRGNVFIHEIYTP